MGLSARWMQILTMLINSKSRGGIDERHHLDLAGLESEKGFASMSRALSDPKGAHMPSWACVFL